MTQESLPIGHPGATAKGIARRQEILDRAIEVFAARGADGTSLRRIAEAIGVSHAALLHYFDSLEQLLLAVYVHANTRKEQEEPDAFDADAVEVMVSAATWNVQQPGIVQLYTTLLAASLEAGRDTSAAFFTDRFTQVRSGIARRLRADQAAGRIRADVDADAVAALIVAASDGLQIQWLLEPSIDLERTLQTLSTLLAPEGSA